MKPLIFAAALGCAAALAGGASQAQWIGPRWNVNIEFTTQDLAIIRGTLRRDIHGKPPSTVTTWSNPASGHSGTITASADLHAEEHAV